jgi:arginine decarboxylase
MARWGLGYFRINQEGHVTAHPGLGAVEGVDLHRLAMDLSEQGVGLPVLLRFSDILRARIREVAEAFSSAIAEFDYQGRHSLVYPIKVNQQRHVVQEIIDFGEPHAVGLECGSKAELQAILGLSDSPSHAIVCNGYKDAEYMRLALMAQRLGHQVFIVLEQLRELDVLIESAAEIGVEPTMGVRIKLGTEGAGRWAKSGGEQSKFGLSPAVLLKLLDRLQADGRESWLQMIHFHLGSQITDIRRIKGALEEIGRYYTELRGMGYPILQVDVGGGLGVDYDGSRSTAAGSVNYSVREYANDVIFTLGSVCRAAGVPMPNVITESGRAVTAHHALLLVDVIDVETPSIPERPDVAPDAHILLREMEENLVDIDHDRVVEVYHDAVFAKERARDLFDSGVLTLVELAQVDQLFRATLSAVRDIAGDDPAFHEIRQHTERLLVDRYFCNFSVFQSLPDSWAIDQLFPVLPIHRLTERPTRRGTLQDITCDSDGVIDRFPGGLDGQPYLPLHPRKDGEPYILAVFLTGAYQEILGDLHNLFGDTNAVHVKILDGGYEVTNVVHGDTVTEVLAYVQYQADDLLTTFRRKVNAALGLSRSEANRFIADYVSCLEGKTYLEGGTG